MSLLRNKWIWAVVAAALVILGLLPYLFSAQPLKQIVVQKVKRKVGGSVSIDRVRFSWLGPQRIEGIHIDTPEIHGTIDEVSSNTPFWAIGSFTSRMEQINGGGTTSMDGKKGQFSVEITLLPSGEMTVEFSGTQLSTSAILKLLKANSSLQTFLGSSFNANGFATIQKDQTGELDLNFSSPNSDGSIKARLTADTVTLRAPLTLAFYLTPELTQQWTQGALSIQSKTPARLKIDPKGFSFPRKYSLAKLQVENGSLDLAQFTLQHANLAPLAKLLKADRLTASQIDMWLTKVDCSLIEGQFQMGRVDALLADSIHVCAWGSADLLKERLNMIFGIPADTLAKSFRIQNVSSSYVLQVPITGSFSQPNIDAKSATAKIAMILAGNQVKQQGGILGGVASIIGKAAEEKSPPPKRPFPWE